MDRSTRETEIKLPFRSAGEALSRLRDLGATVVEPRTFEDNALYDRDLEPLGASGRLLRLRRAGGRAVLTYKEPVAGAHAHKVRTEHETRVDDAGAIERILDGLGYAVRYRYQKYRTLLDLDGLHVFVDETPIGCYVELEGEPAAIDAVAARLGAAPRDYVLATYRDLHARDAERRGAEPGDMVFDAAAGPGA